MNMTGAALNPAAGGPVGGGMMMMNPGGSPAVPTNSERNPEQIKIMLNTYVYEYFLKLRYYDIARALVKDDKFEFRQNAKQSPGHRKDGEVNGVDGDSMDTDVKDDIPEDLPRPAGAVSDSAMQGNGFLFEWFSVFSDLFAAHRNSHKSGNPTPAMQYLLQHQQLQRMRENQQNQNLGRPGAMMNPNFMRAQQLQRGVMNGDMRKQFTPQQMQMMQQQQQGKVQQMAQMVRGEQPDGDPNARPATPVDGDNGGSPSKRPRLEGQQFPAAIMANGRPAVPNVGQQGMMIQAGFNPNNMNQAQFRQNGAMPPKAMAANMTNGMMNMPNANSPMMQAMTQFPDSNAMETYQRNMAMQGMQGVPTGGNGSGNHALQDYQMQLMLLEQQNKKRLMMARQEQHDNTGGRDGQPMAGGVNMQPGMSPSGSRTGTSPNPTDQMKRTPQLGGMPGSPSAGDMTGRSPGPMNFMNGIQPPDYNNPAMFMKEGQMMGPGGPNMRPPTSAEMNMNRPPQQGQQQPQGRMQFPGSQPMQQQQSQGQPQPVGTPNQRDMPPPPLQAPAANSAQRNNQPASPASANAPPTPSQTNKANPKNKKGNNKDGPDRKRPNKKNSTVNAPNAEDNPPATPTSSTPITPVHGNQFNNSGGKGPNQGGQQPPQPQPNAMPPAQPPMPAPDMQTSSFSDFAPNDNFNLDFSTLENSDVLENFDFDSFLNTSNEDTFNLYSGGMVEGFPMDPTDA